MRMIALVPARAGSKGIPGKNKRLFQGCPLWKWTGLTAEEAGVRPVVVSTDDPDIYEEAMAYGYVGIRRPRELAEDAAPMLSVVRHAATCLDRQGWEVLVLLQPTQPLRKPEHVRAALKLLEETGADSVVSVVEIPAHYSPDYAVSIGTRGGKTCLFWSTEMPWGMDAGPKRRQDCRPAYSRDGTVYAIRRETIEAGSLYGQHCVPLIIPRSESVNLDTEEDWQEAERRLSEATAKP